MAGCSPTPPPPIRRLALAVGLLLIVAACTKISPAICPRVGILNDTSALTKLAGGVVVHAEMVEVELDCQYRGGQSAELESNLALEITARRGPAMRGDSVEIQYFVLITDRAGSVLRKRILPLRLEFGGRDTLRLKEHTWQMYFLQDGTSGSSYEIWVGFQLSDAELKYNRDRRKK